MNETETVRQIAFLLCVRAELDTKFGLVLRGVTGIIGQASRLELPTDRHVEELAKSYVAIQVGDNDRGQHKQWWTDKKIESPNQKD